MKIIIVGAAGQIGKAVVTAFENRGVYEIIKVGERSGDIQCDYTDDAAVEQMFRRVGQFDALISVVGRDTSFKKFENLEDDDFRYGFERKFLGQLRLVRKGMEWINDSGSFVLTSGILSHHPIAVSLATGPINSTIDTYVTQISKFLPRGVRINIVSPGPVVEPGQEGGSKVTASQTAQAYVDAVESNFTGRILRVWGSFTERDV